MPWSFDSGLIKVGRSERPHHRIAQHEDRLFVAGVTLVAEHVVACVGGPVTAESALMDRCASAATERRKGAPEIPAEAEDA